MIVPVDATTERERLPVQGLGRGVPTSFEIQPGQLVHGGQRVGVIGARVSMANEQRLVQQLGSGLVETEIQIDTADRVKEPSFHPRLVHQLPLDPVGARIQDLPRRDRVAPRFARICHLEQPDQELRHPLGRRRLLQRAALGPGCPYQPVGGTDEAEGQR